MKNTDLHTHSYYSDGIFSPAEVVRKAKEAGIKNLALTDHNSVSGIDEAIEEGNKLGVNIIPGAELRTKEGEVLCYFIDYKNKEFLNKIKVIQNRSKEVFENIVMELNKKNMNINPDKVLDTDFKRNNVLVDYLFKFLKKEGSIEIKDIKEMMKGDLFEPHFSTEEVVKMIHHAGGVAVLAHPWYSKTFLQEDRMKELVDVGLNGLEISNGGKGEEKTNSINKIKDYAKRYNLILTSGSDYHGDSSIMSTKHELGKHNCDEDVVKRLKEVINK
jgi:hypothetical protein